MHATQLIREGNPQTALQLYTKHGAPPYQANFNIYKRIGVDLFSAKQLDSAEAYNTWSELRDLYLGLLESLAERYWGKNRMGWLHKLKLFSLSLSLICSSLRSPDSQQEFSTLLLIAHHYAARTATAPHQQLAEISTKILVSLLRHTDLIPADKVNALSRSFCLFHDFPRHSTRQDQLVRLLDGRTWPLSSWTGSKLLFSPNSIPTISGISIYMRRSRNDHWTSWTTQTLQTQTFHLRLAFRYQSINKIPFKSSLTDPVAWPALPDGIPAWRGEGVGACRLHGPAGRAGGRQSYLWQPMNFFQGFATGREDELRGIFGERWRSSKSTLHRHWISGPGQQVIPENIVLIFQISSSSGLSLPGECLRTRRTGTSWWWRRRWCPTQTSRWWWWGAGDGDGDGNNDEISKSPLVIYIVFDCQKS